MKEQNTGSTCCHGASKGGGLFFGGALMIFGVAFLLDKMGKLGGFCGWDAWPILFFWGGLLDLLGICKRGAWFGGLIKIGLGTFFGLGVMGYFDLRWDLIWPVLIILLGLIIVSGAAMWQKRSRKKLGEKMDGTHYETSLFMGGHEKVVTEEISTADISCVMGGLKMDLREADVPGDTVVISVNLKMGGIELYVPTNWKVISECSPVMGAVENKARFVPTGDSEKKVIIRGEIFMSGIEIKN